MIAAVNRENFTVYAFEGERNFLHLNQRRIPKNPNPSIITGVIVLLHNPTTANFIQDLLHNFLFNFSLKNTINTKFQKKLIHLLNSFCLIGELRPLIFQQPKVTIKWME